MTSRALRFTLLMVFVGLLAGAAYIVWQEQIARSRAALASREFDDRIEAAARALLEMKSAQSGYVAEGQGEDFWLGRVESILASTRAGLVDLEARATAPAARSAMQAAIEALRDFEQMDRRARSYARSGQRLLASDLIFSDGIDRLDGTVAALDRARDEQRASSSEALRRSARTQLAALLGAAAGGLLLMLAMVPRRDEASRPAPAADPVTSGATTASQRRPAAEEMPNPPETEPPAVPGATLPSGPALAVPMPEPAIDLPAVASLCSELARVLDRESLPAALERTADILNATGIVVWVADPDGRELVPVMAHGYPPAVVGRLGRINRDAENATAAAYRTGLLQTVAADATSNGAIAAPLVGADGPIGVMAAEVLHAAERQDAKRAAAAIIAAQLATLMGPPAVRAEAARA